MAAVKASTAATATAGSVDKGTSGVAKGYSLAHTWEQQAPLSDSQLQAIALLSKLASDRPAPKHLKAESSVAGEEDGAREPTTAEPEDQTSARILHSSHQFASWYTEIEAAMTSEKAQKYRGYAEDLTSQKDTCDQLLHHVLGTLETLDDLQKQQHSVSANTSALHEACQRLVAEKTRLIEFADALRQKLNYFDELDKVSAQFHAATLKVGSDNFLPLLKRLDECIAYVASNPQYADAAVYAMKFRQLQSRALGVVKAHVSNVLKHASAQVVSALEEQAKENAANAKDAGKLAQGAETSILNVRFRASAPELKSLMEEMERQGNRKEYKQLLRDCLTLYCESRLLLLGDIVQERILELAKDQNLQSLIRSGCAYLMQVCQLEYSLFDHFFPPSIIDTSSTEALLDPLCNVLYDCLRPELVHVVDVDSLCELTDILKGEILEEQLARRGESAAGLRPMVLRTLADVQERVSFRMHTYLRDEIAGYVPTQDDLDYPAKLERLYNSTEGAELGATGSNDGVRESAENWFAPVETTLACLAKLYRCVDKHVFSALAQEAVSTCSSCIFDASRQVARRSGPTDGQLFLMKHLLLLREQIAPFNVDFATTYKELDFTHMRDQFVRILSGESSFFAWNSNNALLSLISKGTPRVIESQVDSKKILERDLKTTCEQFIMNATKVTVEPMLSFITKVTAVKVAATNQDGEAKPLREQAFASVERVSEMLKKVLESMDSALPTLASKLKLYLRNPSTRGILFKPIKSNIMEAHGQIASLISEEYTVEEVASLGQISMEELDKKLDKIFS